MFSWRTHSVRRNRFGTPVSFPQSFLFVNFPGNVLQFSVVSVCVSDPVSAEEASAEEDAEEDAEEGGTSGVVSFVASFRAVVPPCVFCTVCSAGAVPGSRACTTQRVVWPRPVQVESVRI